MTDYPDTGPDSGAFAEHALLCHPATPPSAITGVAARLHYHAGRWALTYTVAGGTPRIPPPAAPARTDGLWQTTCFELFVMDGQGGYAEFNFSPSTQWAAYRFAGYRYGMAELGIEAPQIVAIEGGIRVLLDFPADAGARVALSAVIEEADGTKSYWALAHPPGKPDFHHDDCFALRLAAEGEA